MDVASPQALAMTFVKAGWWDRFWAYFLDALILLVPALAFGPAFQVDLVPVALLFGTKPSELVTETLLVNWAVAGAYFVFFWSSAGGGRTLGMRAKGLAVVGTDRAPISVPRAIGRYLMFTVSKAPLFLGLLWAAWDPKKQGWHDKVASTYVIRPSRSTARGVVPAMVAQSGAPSTATQCGTCSAANPAGTRFCGACGAKIGVA